MFCLTPHACQIFHDCHTFHFCYTCHICQILSNLYLVTLVIFCHTWRVIHTCHILSNQPSFVTILMFVRFVRFAPLDTLSYFSKFLSHFSNLSCFFSLFMFIFYTLVTLFPIFHSCSFLSLPSQLVTLVSFSPTSHFLSQQRVEQEIVGLSIIMLNRMVGHWAKFSYTWGQDQGSKFG